MLQATKPHQPLTLWAAWQMSFQPFILNAPSSTYARVLEAWNSTGRRYHTRRHLEECMRLLDWYSTDKPWPAAVALAIFFHDAVYVPGRKDNEERSALMAHAALTAARLPIGVAEEVEELILATQHTRAAGLPLSRGAKLLLDIDLSILGAAPARYWEYVDQVRQEHWQVSDEAFRAGRQKVLAGLQPAEGSYLFHTPEFRNLYEDQARANVSEELERLRA